MEFGYEYFCGANVLVQVESFPILEAAGVSFSAQESKIPIYGYSSRHFDAVARGQVIIQGSLVINYVNQDYLFHAINLGLEKSGKIPSKDVLLPPENNLEDLRNLLADRDNDLIRQEVLEEMINNYRDNLKLSEAFKKTYWPSEVSVSNVSSGSDTPNPFDIYGGIDIKISFGQQLNDPQHHGITGILLSKVYFTGRGTQVAIDEQTIVEEYSFFARSIHSLKKNYAYIPSVNSTGEVTTHSIPSTKGVEKVLSLFSDSANIGNLGD